MPATLDRTEESTGSAGLMACLRRVGSLATRAVDGCTCWPQDGAARKVLVVYAGFLTSLTTLDEARSAAAHVGLERMLPALRRLEAHAAALASPDAATFRNLKVEVQACLDLIAALRQRP